MKLKLIKKKYCRQKSHHKSSKKGKSKKKTTVSDANEVITTKGSEIKDDKDSAFASSDEGITIETFESVKESESKYSNLRKANKPSTASNSINVHKRIHNLEKQMEDVKQLMKLVIPDKANNTEVDAQINAKGKASERKNYDTGENAQTDPKVEVSKQNDTAVEIRVYSGVFNNSDTKTTKTIIKLDTITTLEYETDGETKPSRTTKQENNDETKNIINPTFRSDLAIDNRKSQESNEKYSDIISTLKDHEVTESIKERKTTETEFLNGTTMNATTDSIFKTSEETVAALGFDVQKNGKENISVKVHEESKRKTILKEDVEKDNVQTTTTIVDLTKHLKDSDTVVVNMKENGKKGIMEIKENTNEINDFSLPKTPFFQEDKADPFNDIDVNLDII